MLLSIATQHHVRYHQGWSTFFLLLLVSGLMFGCENTPSSSPEPDAPEGDPLDGERINRFFTNDEIRYFLEIAIGDTTEPKDYFYPDIYFYPNIVKWNEDVRIELQGEISSEDSLVIQSTVNELNRLITPINFKLATGLTNLKLEFLPDSLEVPYLWKYEKSNNYNGSGVLRISAPVSSGFRAYGIQKGLAGAMGLLHESPRYPESIFYNGLFDGYGYAAIDRIIIQILYAPEITTGMDWDQAIRALTNR